MILKLLSMIALSLVILPSVLYFAGLIAHDRVLQTAIAGTFLWFAVTPFWMGRELPVDAAEVEI